MHLISKVVEYQGNPTFTLVPIGDIHDGTIHHDRKLFLRDVQSIADDPHALWIGMGDHSECIVPSDPRFMASEIDPYYLTKLGTLAVSQRDRFIESVTPIKDKCIGLLEGNHEFQIKARHYVDLTMDACRELGVPYLGDTSMIKLTFRRVGEDGKRMYAHVFTIFAEHGTGGGRKTGGKVNSLEELMRDFDADIYLRGHVHTKLATKHPRLYMPENGKPQLVSKTRICGLTGCYYRTYQKDHSSYGQRMSYSPTELGCIRIRIQPRSGEMEVIS